MVREGQKRKKIRKKRRRFICVLKIFKPLLLYRLKGEQCPKGKRIRSLKHDLKVHAVFDLQRLRRVQTWLQLLEPKGFWSAPE